jgi:hypothetical protein
MDCTMESTGRRQQPQDGGVNAALNAQGYLESRVTEDPPGPLITRKSRD